MRAVRERNPLEAWLHGWSILCLSIAATLVVVFGLMAVTGASTTCENWLAPAGLASAAAILHAYSRMARTPA